MKHAAGIAGKIAALFQDSAITPLLALLGLLLGLFAIMVTPKEEEPQIDVTFADIYIPFPGARPAEVEQLVTRPAEEIISQLKGVDTLYSFSQPDGALLIVIFKVGVPRDTAIVNLYNQIYANLAQFPTSAGVGQPQIKPMGIEDVPIVSLTLWSADPQVTAQQLTQLAHGLETALKRIPGTRDITTLAPRDLVLNVRLKPQQMNYFGVSYEQISTVFSANNITSSPLSLVQGNQEIKVKAGAFLQSATDVGQLVVQVRQTTDGRPAPVYLQDVAEISLRPDTPTSSAWHYQLADHTQAKPQGLYPAVTIAIGKQAGENAVTVANEVLEQVAQLQNVLLPDNVHVNVSRNYGVTAAEKSNTLIFKLMFATAAVVILVLFTMGLRESLVVGIAIGITLAVTLFASWAYGFTLNRVSLFALIFSIGILVDDAIVVVENIHRHMAQGTRTMGELIPLAVDEVGGPTILATFTVIAALLPMAFVSGLMGPYMSPIPINASMGMLISLGVAFTITPWLSRHLLKPAAIRSATEHNTAVPLLPLFTRLIKPFLASRRARMALAASIAALIAIALALPVSQLVVLKMLPLDNKSELQVIVDMPEGTPVEQTEKVLKALAQYLATVPEVQDMQLYAGTHAPINFNGLVRHYFLRQTQESGDIQVNLHDKHHRQRDSHSIAQALRPPLQAIAQQYQANVKIVEVPPGPPVWSPIVAEVYGPSNALREKAAKQLLALFQHTANVVDVDIYLPAAQQQWQVSIDRDKASLLGVPYANIVNAITTAIGGKEVGILHQQQQKTPIPIRLAMNDADKPNLTALLTLKLDSQWGTVPLAELVSVHQGSIDAPIIHKNMRPMIMVVADVAGTIDSPLYGMFAIAAAIKQPQGLGLQQFYVQQPDGMEALSVKWDGEWKITYETFRDMGIAYGVGMIAIYLLVVGHFRSYRVPLIIMAPIPLTLIGVMPGHALLGAQFTATSMIGMIALAGIIVRNSILLVDFINQETAAGKPFADAVIHAGAVRAKPIMITALAAILGALFILDDPIFNGLAISLIFGIFIATLLTLVVIPVLYYAAMGHRIGDLHQHAVAIQGANTNPLNDTAH